MAGQAQWFSKPISASSVAGHSLLEVRDRQQDSIKIRPRVGGKQCRKHAVLCFVSFAFSSFLSLSSSVFAWLMKLMFMGGDCFYTSDLSRITVIEAFFS